jgi:hypothetical protein
MSSRDGAQHKISLLIATGYILSLDKSGRPKDFSVLLSNTEQILF